MQYNHQTLRHSSSNMVPQPSIFFFASALNPRRHAAFPPSLRGLRHLLVCCTSRSYVAPNGSRRRPTGCRCCKVSAETRGHGRCCRRCLEEGCSCAHPAPHGCCAPGTGVALLLPKMPRRRLQLRAPGSSWLLCSWNRSSAAAALD
jgi:hypothetical protein